MGKVDKIKVWRRGVWVSAGRKFMFSRYIFITSVSVLDVKFKFRNQ